MTNFVSLFSLRLMLHSQLQFDAILHKSFGLMELAIVFICFPFHFGRSVNSILTFVLVFGVRRRKKGLFNTEVENNVGAHTDFLGGIAF